MRVAIRSARTLARVQKHLHLGYSASLQGRGLSSSRAAMFSNSAFPAPYALQWPDYASIPKDKLESRDPATGEVWKTYEEMPPAEVQEILGSMGSFWVDSWRRTTIAQRAAVIQAIGDGLRAEADTIASIMSKEMGKSVADAKAEVMKSAGLCDWYAKNAGIIMNNGEPIEQPPIAGASRSFYMYEAMGVVLSVMPWNFPVWQVIRQLIPNLVAGNVVVLKHAPNVIGCGLEVEKIVGKAVAATLTEQKGACVFRTLPVSTSQVQPILEHPAVRGVSLTGSEKAGRSVAALAGALLKKSVVELGGNDGYVILEDADLEKVADTMVKARILNMGQSCIGPKRIIVVDKGNRAEELGKRIAEKIKEKEGAGFPPLVHAGARKDVESKVRAAVDAGATCVYGDVGGGPGKSEAFYNPVVLTGIDRANPGFDVEIFGPVFSLITARDEAEAISIHNASSFGLGGGVFGADGDSTRMTRLASEELLTGMCAVNDFVRSDASMPFGGIRNSGIGRECGSHGVLEFVNVKSVSVA